LQGYAAEHSLAHVAGHVGYAGVIGLCSVAIAVLVTAAQIVAPQTPKLERNVVSERPFWLA